ncbi:MAG: hypothetical protein BWK78_04025 [Thiotrichaceae bacterium IS1]|nr:MAG: hypothetical protein BWK78_04025 [Thiotrichaceae bacterium IS1]
MSKFAAQPLFAGKAVSLWGYCSRKVEGVSSALVGWFTWFLSVFLSFFSRNFRAVHLNRWVGMWLVGMVLSTSEMVFAQTETVFSGSVNMSGTRTQTEERGTCTYQLTTTGSLTLKFITGESGEVNVEGQLESQSSASDGVSSDPRQVCHGGNVSNGVVSFPLAQKNGNSISWPQQGFSINLTQETPNHLEGTITASASGSSSSYHYEGTFSLDAPPSALKADFTETPTEGEAPLTVNLDASISKGKIASYNWSSSDGQVASGQTATFKFEKEGDYTITLTVTDDQGKTDTTQQTVKVTGGGIIANFTETPTEGEVPLTVNLDASASEGNITSYDWSSSDGQAASGQTATFKFEKEGDYTITLTVTDDQGKTDTTQQTVKVTGGEIQVKSITSKYPEKTHFLDGLDHEVTYKAEIDWGKQEPGTVSFITPTGTKDVTATGNTAEQALNMGKDFGVCGKLQVVATSKDGKKKSPEKEADFVVMSSLPLSFLLLRIEEGSGFYYAPANIGGIDFKFFDEGIEDGQIREDIPFFGKKGLAFRYLPKVKLAVNSQGEASLELEEDIPVELKMLGEGFSLKPKLNVKNQFTSCQWEKWGGELGVSGSAEASQSWPFLTPTPIPVPMYVKVSLNGAVNTSLTVKDIVFDPPKADFTGKLGISPAIRGSLGVGADEFLSAEGWVEGGAEMAFQYPAPTPPTPVWPNLEKFVGSLTGGLAAQILIWKWENALLKCEWNLVTDKVACSFPVPANRSKFLVQPTLIARDYLTNPDYATLRKTDRGMRDVSTTTTPLQTTVFPYSDAHLSSNSNSLYAVWLMDNPARTAINRTVASFSSYDAADWSDPQAIADDGTADFHPKLLAFYDNSALATWEDVKVALPDTAQLEEMVQNLEISVSKYDPQTKQWTGTQRLTNNAYLDRSPKIAGKDALILGQSNQAIVTWISNPGNDLFGNSTQPNQLWSAQWLNNAWTTPQQVVDVPYPLFKYDLVYNGQTAYVVMSVDTDGDLTTIADHELFQIAFTNSTWGILTRLTNDTLADDNPQLGIDPKGNFMLVWLKENELSSVVNFDFNTRVVVRKDESGYSSNLADFKLATSADGKLALVWAEPSAYYSSDLHTLFYKPLVNLWGNPKQLTFDPETEKRVTAAFYGNDTLIALYNRGPVGELPTEATVNSNSLSVDQPTMVSTDLFMLKHTVRNADFTTTDLPELGAIATNNTFAINETGDFMDTQTVLNGGLSINGGPFKKLVEFKENLGHGEDAQIVTVKGVITPTDEHNGKVADIFAYGEFKPYTEQELTDTTCPVPPQDPNAVPYYVMESLPKNYIVWNGPKTSATIPAFLYKDITLTAGKSQEFTLFEGPFDARGCLSISFGYRLQDSGVVVYNHHTATVDNGIGVTVRKK